MSNLTALIEELTEALRATVGPEFEGFQDLELLNISPASKAQVNFDINAAKRRRDRVQSALDALQALLEDGYPDVPLIEVAPEVFDDLFDQGVSIQAALGRYRRLPEGAVGGRVTID